MTDIVPDVGIGFEFLAASFFLVFAVVMLVVNPSKIVVASGRGKYRHPPEYSPLVIFSAILEQVDCDGNESECPTSKIATNGNRVGF